MPPGEVCGLHACDAADHSCAGEILTSTPSNWIGLSAAATRIVSLLLPGNALLGIEYVSSRFPFSKLRAFANLAATSFTVTAGF